MKFELEELINTEWEEVKESYTKLGEIILVKDKWQSLGQIDIVDSSGILWSTFSVRIEVPNNYPLLPPVIFETAGELPKDADWHINGDGSCCVGPNAKIFRKLNNNLTIIKWLDIVVMPFLFDQVHRIEKGEYSGKLHDHGARGLLNDYREWWKFDSDYKVIDKLKLITGETKTPRNDYCFCGKDLKYKKCHLFASEFDGIPIEVYHNDLKAILANTR